MTFVYIVRCNFTEPAKEQAWNAWYSGPKIEQMLAKPYFQTCQRFRIAAGSGRKYLTMWTLESPEAFNTAEYTSDWGFFEWSPYIVDWSRDLFDGRPASQRSFAVPRAGSLHTVTFDGMSADAANAARAAAAGEEPQMMWLPVAGLDRHTPFIGLRSLPDAVSCRPPVHARAERMQEAIYQPISDLCTRSK